MGIVNPDFDGRSLIGTDNFEPNVTVSPPGLIGAVTGGVTVAPSGVSHSGTGLASAVAGLATDINEDGIASALGETVTATLGNLGIDLGEETGVGFLGDPNATSENETSIASNFGYDNGGTTGPDGGGHGSDNIPEGGSTPPPQVTPSIAEPIAEPIAPPIAQSIASSTPPDQYVFGQYGNTYLHKPAGLSTANAPIG